MNYQADLYIMLPCLQNSDHKAFPQSGVDAESFIAELSQCSRYEFKSELGEQIERSFLHRVILVAKSDDRENPVTLGKQEAFLVLSSYHGTAFRIVTIVVTDVAVSLTHLLDQASRGGLYIIEQAEEELLLTDWLIRDCGLSTVGDAYFASCLSALPDEEAPYLLSGEAYFPELEYRIRSSATDALLAENHAQYSHYDAYMSCRGVTYVMKDFGETYCERLNTECLLIFIMELVLLKITVINSANNDILSAFARKNVSLDEILRISGRFTQSLPLWNISYFRYFLAQEFANRVENAFRVSQHIAEYDKNRAFLEQVISIRNLIASEQEAKMVTVFATILAVLQVAPLLYAAVIFFLEGGMFGVPQLVALASSSAVSLLAIWLVFRKKPRRKQ